jgi:hypothetical protein
MDYPYATSAPSPQQTLDLFFGRWVSRLPGHLGSLNAGANGHFEDDRIVWAQDAFGKVGVSIHDSTILELGPLDGGHTYMLSAMGARSVTAIEAHRDAYLRCLVSKELLNIERVKFLYGDAIAFLRSDPGFFDISVACGFLYHMINPVELLRMLCQKSSAVFLWTVYWDPEFNRLHPAKAAATGEVSPSVHEGFRHILHRQDYGNVSDYSRFWGGPAPYANWMELPHILEAFPFFGFSRVHYQLENNPNGSALRLVAARG